MISQPKVVAGLIEQAAKKREAHRQVVSPSGDRTQFPAQRAVVISPPVTTARPQPASRL